MATARQKPDFTARPDLLKRLIYSKYLLNRARLLQQEANELACAQVVLTAHDSVEMLIRVIADHVKAEQSQKFMEQLRLIKKATDKEPPYMSDVDRLNHLRVSFKHKGNMPHPPDVEGLMPRVCAFCAEATAQYLAVDFDTVSLADLILNPLARDEVKRAETFKTEGNILDAVIALRMGFDHLYTEARNKRKPILIVGVDPPGLEFIPRDSSALWSLVKELKLYNLKLAVHQLVETVNGMVMGLEPATFRRFSELTPFAIHTGFDRKVSYLWSYSPRLQTLWRAFF